MPGEEIFREKRLNRLAWLSAALYHEEYCGHSMRLFFGDSLGVANPVSSVWDVGVRS